MGGARKEQDKEKVIGVLFHWRLMESDKTHEKYLSICSHLREPKFDTNLIWYFVEQQKKKTTCIDFPTILIFYSYSTENA